MHRKIMRIIWSCELSDPIIHYIFINGRKLCPEQACELSRVCKLARVKLSELHCTMTAPSLKLVCTLDESWSAGKALRPQPGIKPKPLDLTSSALPTKLSGNLLLQQHHLSRWLVLCQVAPSRLCPLILNPEEDVYHQICQGPSDCFFCVLKLVCALCFIHTKWKLKRFFLWCLVWTVA